MAIAHNSPWHAGAGPGLGGGGGGGAGGGLGGRAPPPEARPLKKLA